MAVFLATIGTVYGEETYLGASEALKKAARLAATDKTEGADEKDSRKRIIADLDIYKTSLPGLKPEEAAAQWMAFVDRLGRLEADIYNRSYEDMMELDFGTLARALPPPAAWPHLRKILEQKEPEGKAETARLEILKWYVNRLLGDVKAMLANMNALSKLISAVKTDFGSYRMQFLDPMEQQMLVLLDSGDDIMKLLDRRLDSAVEYSTGRSRDRSDFFVPNLVALVGEEKAGTYLKKVLTTLPAQIRIQSGRQTAKLASKIALENIVGLKVAQWPLAESLDDAALYAAMLKRFGPAEDDSSFQDARAAEFVRLLLAGRFDEAKGFAQTLSQAQSFSLSPDMLEVISSSTRLDEINSFFNAELSANPNLPLWRSYISIALRAEASEKMVELLRQSLAGSNLETSVRAELADAYTSVLLASDKIDQGVTELIKASEKSLEETSPSDRRFAYSRGENDAIQVARIGLLLDRKEWVEKGTELAASILKKKLKDAQDNYDFQSFATSYAELLLDIGRGPAAEAVLIETLGATEALAKKKESEGYPGFSDSAEILCALTGLYTAANRSADVLILLDQATGWGAADISSVSSDTCYLGEGRSAPLALCAARALIAQGRKDEARRILEALLVTRSGDDRVYETLVALDGAGAIALLDRTFARDPFEERPLVWKAKLLLDDGKLEEAERVAREAIKIDPSDGEEGSGDRMRVYAVLADVLAARGDAKQAEFFRGVVRAIRKSELADKLNAQGLLTRAILLYKESLNDFADAYCIQSRLALRLSEQGDWKGAEEHYRRAYELMPDSFGRVESHCFGCERAFAGERQESLAEKIFSGMAARPPVRPQVYYLLGYLRIEHDRFQEALVALEKAVEIDPDYLNAWKKLDSLENEVLVPAATRNLIAQNLIRLDPYHKHGQPDLSGVTDLGVVWNLLEKSQPPVALTELYPLKASALAAEEKQEGSGEQRRFARMLAISRGRQIVETAPASILAGQSFTEIAGNLMQTSGSLFAR